MGVNTGIGIQLDGTGGGQGFVTFTKTADGLPAIFSGVDRTAAETARDNYFGANPDDLDLLDANQFLLIQLIDESMDPDLVIFQDFRDPDFFDVNGVVSGPPGDDAPSQWFLNEADRNNFYDANLTLLMTGLIVGVNNATGSYSVYEWTGGDAPGAQDITLWRSMGESFSVDSVVLGRDGARIASGNQVINFDTPAGETQTFIAIPYTTAGGSDAPFCYVLTQEVNFNAATVDTDDLADPQDVQADGFGLSSIYLQSVTIKPHETGDLRIQAWIGTADTDPQIIDVTQAITGGDVGNETVIPIPNPVLLRAPEQNLFRFSGVGLRGGLQTTGEFNGLTVPFMDIGVMVASQVALVTDLIDFITMREGPSNTATFKIVNAAQTLDKYDLTYSDAASTVTTTYGDAGIIALGANHLDFIQTTGDITFTQNSVSSDFSVVSVNPEGSLTKNQGSLALFISGDSSGIFFKQTGTGNTGWVEVVHAGSGITGPVSSSLNSLATWADLVGGSLNSLLNTSITDDGTDLIFDLQSPSVSGTARRTFSDSSGTSIVEMNYDEASNNFTVSTGSTTSTIQFIGDDLDFLYQAGGSTNNFKLDLTALPDTVPAFTIDTGGLNGSSVDVHLGVRNPNTVVSGTPGALYYRSNGATTTMYVHADVVTSVNNWINVIAAGSGNVSGPAVSVINEFAFFSVTDGTVIDSASGLFAVSGPGGDRRIDIESVGASGTALLTLSNDGGGTGLMIEHDDATNLSQIIGDIGGLSISTTLDNDITLSMGGATSQLIITNSSSPDTNELMTWITGGANGATTGILLGNQSPIGNITAAPGRIHVEVNGNSSTMRIHEGTIADDTSWADFLTVNSGVQGPVSSTTNAIPTWQNTLGNSIVDNPELLYETAGNNRDLAVRSPGATGLPAINIRDSTNLDIIRFVYSENTDTSFFESVATDNLFLFNFGGVEFQVSTDLVLETQSTFTSFLRNTGDDTNPPLTLDVSGTNGAQTQIFSSDQTPVGNIVGNPGDVTFTHDGVGSGVYYQNGATANNTDWIQLLGVGQAIGAVGTSVDRDILAWNGTGGASVLANTGLSAQADGSTRRLVITPNGATSNSELRLNTSIDTTGLEFRRTNDTLGSEINNAIGTLTIDNTVANEDMLFNVNTGDDFIFNDNVRLTVSATQSLLRLDSPSATGAALIRYIDSGLGTPFLTGYDETDNEAQITATTGTPLVITSVDDLSMTCTAGSLIIECQGSGLTGDITIESDETLVLFSDNDAIQITTNNGVNATVCQFSNQTSSLDSRLFVTDDTPISNIVGNPSDLAIRNDGADSNLYLHTGATWEGLRNFRSVGGVFVNNNATVTTISAINTFTDFNLNGSAAAAANNINWTVTNTTTGEIRYDADDDITPLFIATISGLGDTGQDTYQYRILINGAVTADGIISETTTNSNSKNVCHLELLSISTNDLVRMQVQNITAADDWTIVDLAIVIR